MDQTIAISGTAHNGNAHRHRRPRQLVYLGIVKRVTPELREHGECDDE
jgi:hypothetical protein